MKVPSCITLERSFVRLEARQKDACFNRAGPRIGGTFGAGEKEEPKTMGSVKHPPRV